MLGPAGKVKKKTRSKARGRIHVRVPSSPEVVHSRLIREQKEEVVGKGPAPRRPHSSTLHLTRA